MDSGRSTSLQNYNGSIHRSRAASCGIIVDDADSEGVSITGSWTSSTASAGFYGADYLHDGDINKGLDNLTFTPNLPQAGSYNVYGRWTANANRATNVPYGIVYSGGTNTVLINQTSQGGQWILLMTTNFSAGTNGYVRVYNGGTTGYVIADAVEFVFNLPIVNV